MDLISIEGKESKEYLFKVC